MAQRMRSLLTALGILIGVAAVILTVGIGLGARQTITAKIMALGSNLITIVPGSTTSGGVRAGLGAAATLTVDDARALDDRSVAPDVIAVSPMVTRSTPMVAGSQNWTATTTGSTPEWMVTNNRTMTSGMFFTDADVAARAHVAVLGATTAEKLFGSASPVGRTVVIQRLPFTVIGVLNLVGAQGYSSPDDQAVIPLTTAQAQLITGGSLTSVQAILVSAPTRAAIGSAYQEVDNLLLQTHHINDPTTADFSIGTQETILSTVDSVTGALTLFLAGIAGISLLVGGIGVMNIMLVSVTERVAEIGLRKAVGARRGDILRQFLVEAATLSALGGVLGVGAGLGCTTLLSHLTPLQAMFSPSAALLGVFIAAGIGVAFGVFPAMRAARLAPIEALRSA